jgi:hypothetical protein
MKRVNRSDLIISYLSAFIWMIILAGGGAAQTTAFTYQGKLTDAGTPATGTYDMQFKLFDTATVGTGTQQGATVINQTVQVVAGNFIMNLDFGTNVFTGAARFLEISVRPAGNTNPYTILAPRQPITASPYAIQTVNATQLGGLPASRYVAADGNGNVGIGTTSPVTKLELVDPVRQLRFGPTTADNGGYLVSTNPSQAITAGGARWDGANWIARDTLASLTANQNGTIEFLTDSNLTVGNPFNPTLRMQIDVNGRVVIGRPNKLNLGQLQVTTDNDVGVYGTSTNGTGVIGESELFPGVQGFSGNSSGVIGHSIFAAGVSGFSEHSYAGHFTGNVFVTGTVTQGSDARLKLGIRTLNYGLAEVLRLRPVTWRWKEHPERGPQLGLVAQEVESVLPELVSTSKDAEQMKGLNYTGLLPVLIKSIQQQQAQIEEQNRILKKQQTRIEQQQRQIGALRQAVKALKSATRNPQRK